VTPVRRRSIRAGRSGRAEWTPSGRGAVTVCAGATRHGARAGPGWARQAGPAGPRWRGLSSRRVARRDASDRDSDSRRTPLGAAASSGPAGPFESTSVPGYPAAKGDPPPSRARSRRREPGRRRSQPGRLRLPGRLTLAAARPARGLRTRSLETRTPEPRPQSKSVAARLWRATATPLAPRPCCTGRADAVIRSDSETRCRQ
jgi:hypothetical protein